VARVQRSPRNASSSRKMLAVWLPCCRSDSANTASWARVLWC